MSGASGPTTGPREMLAIAAIVMLIIANAAGGAAPGLNPSAGTSPPAPGRYRTVAPTTRPASVNGSSGHHVGVDEKPRPLGRSV